MWEKNSTGRWRIDFDGHDLGIYYLGRKGDCLVELGRSIFEGSRLFRGFR